MKNESGQEEVKEETLLGVCAKMVKIAEGTDKDKPQHPSFWFYFGMMNAIINQPPAPQLPSQSPPAEIRQEEIDWESAYEIMRDTFIEAHKELIELKSQPTSSFSRNEVSKDDYETLEYNLNQCRARLKEQDEVIAVYLEIEDALQELVRLKDIKDAADNYVTAGLPDQAKQIMEQYKIDKPLAWAKARSLMP